MFINGKNNLLIFSRLALDTHTHTPESVRTRIRRSHRTVIKGSATGISTTPVSKGMA